MSVNCEEGPGENIGRETNPTEVPNDAGHASTDVYYNDAGTTSAQVYRIIIASIFGVWGIFIKCPNPFFLFPDGILLT